MQENFFPRCRVYAWVAWAVTFALVAAAWVAMFQQPRAWHLAGLLAFTAAICSAVAAVLHVRSFLVRVTSLIRATYGIERPSPNGPTDLHPIR